MTSEERSGTGENITISPSTKTGFHLLVRQIVKLSVPFPTTITDEIAEFWSRRRVRFSEVTGKIMHGQRGSLWWNAVTFDMSKLRSDLTVLLDQEQGQVECLLDVKTTLQQITPMNQMYWVEEMIAFESYLQSGDEKKEEWVEFQKAYRQDNKRWVWGLVVTIGIAAVVGEVVGGLLSWFLGVLTGSK